jgi:hypothetical protein
MWLRGEGVGMNLLMEAMRGLGAVMLQVVAALLLEELTFGGLVRLFVAPRPGAGRSGVPGDGSSSLVCRGGVPGDRSSSLGSRGGVPGDRSLSLRRKIREHKHKKGEGKCSH